MIKIYKDKSILLILVFVLIGLFLRLYRLTQSPPRLTIDELSIGYNAYSLLQTGKDEWGKTFPLVFRAFGDYKLPAYIYATLPFVHVFGLNSLGVRFVSVLAGTAMIFGLAWLAYLFTGKRNIAALAALILAISPWPIHLSRIGLESNLACAFFVFGLAFTYKSFKNHQPINGLIAGIFFGLTLYSYIAYRLIVLFLMVYLLIKTASRRSYIKTTKILIITLIIISLPLLGQVISFSGQARFKQISIFTDKGIVSEINEDRALCYLQNPKNLPKVCAVFSNKPLSWSLSFADNYLQSFFPSFLFIEGSNLNYLSVPGFGEFNIILIPAFIMGIFVLIKRKYPNSDLIIVALLISAVPSALAGPPHVVRASALAPLVALICALGLDWLYQYIIKKKTQKFVISGLFCLIFIFLSIKYLVNFLYIYPAQFDSSLYPLPPELGNYLKEIQSKYQKIYFYEVGPGNHMYVAFYTAYPPLKYQKDVVWPLPSNTGFTHPQKLGKYEFGTKTLDKVICDGETNVLYVINRDDRFIPIKSFNNFTQTYPQAQVFDIDVLRTENPDFCQNLIQKRDFPTR